MNFDPGAYGSWFDSPRGSSVERLEKRALDHLLPNIAGKRVLDLGAGEGRFSAHLAERGALVTAIDRSPAMVRAAASRYGYENLFFTEGRGEALAFSDESFDVAVALTMLCFAEPRPVLRELHRVLRPNGLLVIAELNARSPWAWWRKLRSRAWRQTPLMSSGRLRALLANTGFHVTAMRGAVFAPPFEGRAYWNMALAWEERFAHLPAGLGAALLFARGEKP